MKALLGTLGFLGGLFVSLGMFVVGIVAAAWFLAAEPVVQAQASSDTDRLWTVAPRKIDLAAQDFERLPPVQQAVSPSDATDENIDETTTAAVETAITNPAASGPTMTDPAIADTGKQDRLSVDVASHVAWCERRYRSYSREDNSYMSYDGDVLPCVSPYSAQLTGGGENAVPVAGADLDAVFMPEARNDASTYDEQPSGDDGAMLVAAQYAAEGAADPGRVSDCFARYRTYRPSDNSYQPYGGGPRRQCY